MFCSSKLYFFIALHFLINLICKKSIKFYIVIYYMNDLNEMFHEDKNNLLSSDHYLKSSTNGKLSK